MRSQSLEADVDHMIQHRNRDKSSPQESRSIASQAEAGVLTGAVSIRVNNEAPTNPWLVP